MNRVGRGSDIIIYEAQLLN